MTLMLATMQLAIIGWYQVSADAAAFYQAHQLALGGMSNVSGTTTYTKSLMPDALSNVTFNAASPTSAPSSYVGGNNTYGSGATPDPNSPYVQPTGRHAGFSIVQGMEINSQASVPVQNGLFGLPITVMGNAIEPYYEEMNSHFGDIGTNPNDDTNPQALFSGNGAENSPPYFVGWHIMRICGAPGSGNLISSSNSRAPAPAAPNVSGESFYNWALLNGNNDPTTCPGYASTSYLGWNLLGLAEYLGEYFDYSAGDTNNWHSTTGSQNGISSGAPFQYMACHQRVYANLAAQLYAGGTAHNSFSLNSTTGVISDSVIANTLSAYNSSGTATYIAQIYSWDYTSTGGNISSAGGYGSTPLNPGGGC